MKKSVTKQAAWIVGVLGIVGVVITGLFSLFGPDKQTIKVADKGVIGGFVFGASSMTINNYNVPDSSTKDAIREFEKRLQTTDDKINLSRNEIALLTKALKDLDQRTSGIEKLPDGRTKLGNFISGQPRIIIEEQAASFDFFKKQNYKEALFHSQNAIKAYEETNKIGVAGISTGDLPNTDVAKIYRLAALSAQQLNERQLAYQYAKKTMEIENNALNMALLSTTLFDLDKKEEAVTCIDEALKTEPNNQEFINLKNKFSKKYKLFSDVSDDY